MLFLIKRFFIPLFYLLASTTSGLASGKAVEDGAYILAGTIGIYESPYVMKLKKEGASLTGEYFYVAYLKDIDLKGRIDPDGTAFMREAVDNSITGFFSFWFQGDKFEGKWSPEKGMSEPETFLVKYIGLEEDENPVFEKLTGHYIKTHRVQGMGVHNFGESEEITDKLNIAYVASNYFMFYNRVTGGNFHLGKISGLAIIKPDGTGLFDDGEGCTIEFYFDAPDENEITTMSNGCGRYGGARVTFDGQYKREL